jgi:hypothetical protein
MDIKLNRGFPGMPGMPQIPTALPMLLFVLGGGFLALGALLIANEWLLRWLVAGVFLVIGALLVVTGLRAKKLLG